MDDIIVRMRVLTVLDEPAFAQALCERAGKPYQSEVLAMHPRPKWLEQAATSWVIELWQLERNNCEASQLWNVDQKYYQIFKDYTVADMVAILAELKKPTS